MTSSPSTTEAPATAAPRDGQHDFDFAIGRWRFDLRRLRDPLTGSTEWVEYHGESRARPLWDGRANIDELRTKPRFMPITGGGLRESHPHDVAITREAPNYHL